jgi:hypothetical protein
MAKERKGLLVSGQWFGTMLLAEQHETREGQLSMNGILRG